MEKHFSKIIGFLIFLTFDLMILGAGVRTMDAGLACPDWPMCFGQAVPEFHFGVYLEFIHRSIAGILGLIYMGCFIFALVKPRFKSVRWTMTVALLLLFSQIIMGGLTVLKLLEPGIVILHLGLAGAFLISLIILKWQLDKIENTLPKDLIVEKVFPPMYRNYATVAFILICGQILLGGLVASNYAGAVCIDFPTCNGQWFPAWTGPIGIQVIHRLGAYTLSAFLIFFFIYTLNLYRKNLVSAKDKQLAAQCFILVISQVMIGVFNLKLLIPAWLTVIHLGVALYLMMTLLKINLRVYTKI